MACKDNCQFFSSFASSFKALALMAKALSFLGFFLSISIDVGDRYLGLPVTQRNSVAGTSSLRFRSSRCVHERPKDV
jgi:hypothetical protein